MKYIKKFEDKDEIINISESFAEGLSVPCTCHVYEYWSRKEYEIHFMLLGPKSQLDASEFNQKRISFESRINAIGYELLWKRVDSTRIFLQSDPIEGKRMNSFLAMLQKVSS